ncbi:MAG: 16S rRNA (cytidine(1402)-2'-O)-methyltransferase [Brevinematia bacterium]
MKEIYIVATPIGNLEDITIRAINTLKEVDIILCENPKNHLKLLKHYGIKGKRLIKITSANEENSINGIIKLLEIGKKVALVSDAGTPNISDPGGTIVKELTKRGIKCTPIPGPSSLTAALSVSPINISKFIFYGFLPKNTNKVVKVINELKDGKLPIVFFVSSHKIEELIQILCKHFPNIEIAIFKEITKINEEVIFGKPCEIKIETKGEFVVIVKP